MRTERAVAPRGFSRWIRPVMRGYKLGCCDCGLVHDVEFRAVEIERVYANGVKVGRILPRGKYQVEFRVRRAPRYTATARKTKGRR